MKRNFYPVILSEAKNLAPFLGEMLHFVQHDKGVIDSQRIRIFSRLLYNLVETVAPGLRAGRD